MAFDARRFVICSKFPLFKADSNLWLYTTSDSLEDCLSENYFQPRMNTKNQDSPVVGDIIQCIVGTGTLAYLRITAKTEKPYNITVEKTYLENEAEIYEAIYLAANSGDQLYETGVWYAKMYSDTVVPSGAEYDGRNYADFSQVDNEGNPIIVIYEGQNGSWVEIDRITPPAEYNGYMTITSKIWDISEQAGQQGGKVLWSHNQKTFTPYPQIISFEDIEITGTSTVIMPNNPGANQIVNRDYVDNQIPTVNDPTITITQGGVTKGSFTLNQAAGDTIDLDAGGSIDMVMPDYANAENISFPYTATRPGYLSVQFTGNSTVGINIDGIQVNQMSWNAGKTCVFWAMIGTGSTATNISTSGTVVNSAKFIPCKGV